jgi:phospholipid-binding lipoprotein MlaA
MNSTYSAALAVLALTLTACTSVPNYKPDPRDPLERLNRTTFAFNDALDRNFARPLARGYRRVTPDPIETGISNFFANLEYPTVLVNNALQGKIGAAASDTGRLLVNTTFGLGGFLDPATRMGLTRHDEDFGQTLGTWGVPPGAYIVVPVLGPYSVRDGVASLADEFTEPRQYLEDDSTRWGLWAGKQIDKRARLLDADALLERAGDKYVLVRSAYLQRREYRVRDGNVPDDTSFEEEFEYDDAEASQEPAVSPEAPAVPPTR